MLFKTISKDDFRELVNGVIKENVTIGPKAADKDSQGNLVYQFKQVSSFDEIALDYTKTYSSVKNFFLPFKEDLSTFHFDKKEWKQEISYMIHPRVIVGVRACDIAGLLKLDNVFMKGTYPNPYYVARRKNTFLIGLDHEPLEDCFCQSLNSDVVLHGFDLFLTDIGDKYFMKIDSSSAFNLLKNAHIADVTEEDQKRYIEEKKRLASLFKTKIEVTGLPSLMDIEFESDVWKKWGDKCLSCGSCAMVCPTCYCYAVNEHIDVSLKFARKERMLYSCNLVDFAEVAGGHNFRPESKSRLKYRLYHQHRGFVESYDEPKCVGCNRCGTACPAGIRPVDVILDLRREEVQ
jgi:formate hydrogenlyase subunit 6/NADH:ubiquinone oxidoreductase subunit I